jgi:hypothetical protein
MSFGTKPGQNTKTEMEKVSNSITQMYKVVQGIHENLVKTKEYNTYVKTRKESALEGKWQDIEEHYKSYKSLFYKLKYEKSENDYQLLDTQKGHLKKSFVGFVEAINKYYSVILSTSDDTDKENFEHNMNVLVESIKESDWRGFSKDTNAIISQSLKDIKELQQIYSRIENNKQSKSLLRKPPALANPFLGSENGLVTASTASNQQRKPLRPSRQPYSDSLSSQRPLINTGLSSHPKNRLAVVPSPSNPDSFHTADSQSPSAPSSPIENSTTPQAGSIGNPFDIGTTLTQTKPPSLKSHVTDRPPIISKVSQKVTDNSAKDAMYRTLQTVPSPDGKLPPLKLKPAELQMINGNTRKSPENSVSVTNTGTPANSFSELADTITMRSVSTNNAIPNTSSLTTASNTAVSSDNTEPHTVTISTILPNTNSTSTVSPSTIRTDYNNSIPTATTVTNILDNTSSASVNDVSLPVDNTIASHSLASTSPTVTFTPTSASSSSTSTPETPERTPKNDVISQLKRLSLNVYNPKETWEALKKGSISDVFASYLLKVVVDIIQALTTLLSQEANQQDMESILAQTPSPSPVRPDTPYYICIEKDNTIAKNVQGIADDINFDIFIPSLGMQSVDVLKLLRDILWGDDKQLTNIIKIVTVTLTPLSNEEKASVLFNYIALAQTILTERATQEGILTEHTRYKNVYSVDA